MSTAIDELLQNQEQRPVEENGPNLTEEVCQLARYELEKAGLFESRKTNADEDVLTFELSADIQTFVDTWIEKRLAVER